MRPYFNKDYASASLNTGLADVANGKGAMYPQLGASAAAIDTIAPGKSKDVGLFALPGDSPSTNGLTVWRRAAAYIPTSTKGDKLDEAEKFLAFLASKPGCDAQTAAVPPTGPYLVKACTLPSNVSQVAKDTEAYFKAGKESPALEFLSPVKGPNLEQICIQVGTGQVSPASRAQLTTRTSRRRPSSSGLPGW